MENEMTGYILTLLENYAKTTKEIELLRYELQHCNIVSPEEMIETMALSRRERIIRTAVIPMTLQVSRCASGR